MVKLLRCVIRNYLSRPDKSKTLEHILMQELPLTDVPTGQSEAVLDKSP